MNNSGWVKRNTVNSENYLIAALVVAAWVWWVYGNAHQTLSSMVQGSRVAVYGTSATIFGSLLGFVITALSIVLVLATSDRLNFIKDDQSYAGFWKVFTSTLSSFGVTTVAWFLALFIDRENSPHPGLLLTCLVLSIVGIYRLALCVNLLGNLTKKLTASSRKEKI